MKPSPRQPAVYFTPVCLIVACLVCEAMLLRVGIDDLDEGYFVQQAVRVLHGQVPYRDFETLYTPGLLYVHAALFSLLGGPSLLAMRGLALLARAATAALLYVLARPLLSRPLLAAAPALLVLLGFDDAPVRWEPHPGWLSTFFALLAVWCLAHPPTRSRLIGAGLAAGASYVFKQNTGVFIMAAIVARSVACACLSRTRRSADVPRPGASPGRAESIALPVLSFVGFTLVWLVPLLVAIDGRLSLLGGFVGAVNQSGLFSPPEQLVLIPVACLVGGVWLWRRSDNPRLRWYVLAGCAMFLTEYPRMDTPHLAWSAPLLLVVGSLVLDQLCLIVAVPLAILTLVACLPGITSRIDFTRQATTPMVDVPLADGLVAPRASVDDLRGLVTDIRQRTHTGEPIFVYPTSPLVYVLADRPNPTRFDHLNPGAADRQQVAALIADLSATHVNLVVVSDYWVGVWGGPGPNAPLTEWLAARFTQVDRFGAYRVLLARL